MAQNENDKARRANKIDRDQRYRDKKKRRDGGGNKC